MSRHLYNLQMNEYDLVQEHINEYEVLSSQLLTQGVNIEDKLKALVSMSNMPQSRKLMSPLCGTCHDMAPQKIEPMTLCYTGSSHTIKI